MASDQSQLTNMMMLNPWMFDPSQMSNQFSNYNNAALPFPPSYNTGAGGPVSAATGQPIQSFQAWQQANPGGTTINNTPAQPQAPQGQTIGQGFAQALGMGANPQAASMLMASLGMGQGVQNQTYGGGPQQPQQAAAPQASGQPNNWYAALNALSNPGTPAIGGATVPMQTGYQPAGGVNNAFLNQAQGRPGMNQNFMSALGAIQGRPQQ